MSDKVTDLSYLEDLGMGDKTLLREMIELFLSNTPESLRLIKKYELNEEWEKLGAEVHKLKPNLSYMGLEGAKERILEIEESVRNSSDLASISSKIQEIDVICKKAYSELSEKLKDLQ